MGAKNCFDKSFVKFMYLPPPMTLYPVDCTKTKFIRFPEIQFLIQQAKGVPVSPRTSTSLNLMKHVGIDIHGAVVTSQDVGGVILLLQVSAYVHWRIGFMGLPPQFTPAPRPSRGPVNDIISEGMRIKRTTPQHVEELHAIWISLPILYKIPGPQMLLMSWTPTPMKLAVYASKIYNVFRKIHEVEKVLALVNSFKNGFCSEDAKALDFGLSKLEKELSSGLRRLWYSDEEEIANLMQRNVGGNMRVAGSRMA